MERSVFQDLQDLTSGRRCHLASGRLSSPRAGGVRFLGIKPIHCLNALLTGLLFALPLPPTESERTVSQVTVERRHVRRAKEKRPPTSAIFHKLKMGCDSGRVGACGGLAAALRARGVVGMAAVAARRRSAGDPKSAERSESSLRFMGDFPLDGEFFRVQCQESDSKSCAAVISTMPSASHRPACVFG